ncbi:hypothetical protein ACFVJ4_32755 [Streptomyces sp. NPDC127178]|uniref:hypothetical protein n=1 Tax=unclassified Streptomyces TaxID=2593676 RepID=UPI00363EE08A
MNVEIPADVREVATQLGAGVPYALRVLAGQLADDPDMGRPSGTPGILTVTVDGDLFEDFPTSPSATSVSRTGSRSGP